MDKPSKLSELDQLHALGDAKRGTISRSNRGIPLPNPVVDRITVRLTPSSSSSSSSSTIPLEKTAAMGHRVNDAYMRDWDKAYAELEASSSSSSSSSRPSRMLTNQANTTIVNTHDLSSSSSSNYSASRTSSAGSNHSTNTKGPYQSYGSNSTNRTTGSVGNTSTSKVASIPLRKGPPNVSSSSTVSRIVSSSTSVSVLEDEEDETTMNRPTGASSSRSSSGILASPSSSSSLLSVSSSYLSLTNPQWSKGPIDPAGRLIDLSDRPNLCMAIDRGRNEAVIGSSDHAVYTIDVRNGRLARRLYGGKYGHTEWVTSVCYVGNQAGRIVSAGMDGKICVWNSGGGSSTGTGRSIPVSKTATCTDLVGHFGSVSLVASPGGGTSYCGPATTSGWNSYIVSGGYDKTVRLWDSTKGNCLMTAKAHQAPILVASLLAYDDTNFWGITGDRDGIANVWRFHDQVCDGSLKGHRGHLTACAWIPGDINTLVNDGNGTNGEGENTTTSPTSSSGYTGGRDLAVTGAQDGHIRVWDLRDSKQCIANIGAHASEQGSGAVGDITVARIGNEMVIISGGADKRLCVLDPRMGFQVRYTFHEHNDFIYSLATGGNYCFSGSGDGLVYVHDISLGRVVWGVGAGMAAIRCIGILSNKHMVCTGDDGKAIVYDF